MKALDVFFSCISSGKRQVFPIENRESGRIIVEGKEFWDFGSNDYLGLSRWSEYKEYLKGHSIGVGSSASRLLSGNCNIFREVEKKWAVFRGKEDCIFFPSGYQMNVSLIPMLVDDNTVIVADRLVHASIIDGMRLSGARFRRFRHNDVEDAKRIIKAVKGEFGRVLVITESLFSMEGDFADLVGLGKLCREYGCIFYVDEAHSVGIWNIEGIDYVDVLVGTFGKAVGLWGAYVAGESNLIDTIINRCRGMIFTTAVSPILFGLVGVFLENLEEVNQRRRILIENVGWLCEEFFDKFKCKCFSQIVPVMIGDDEKAVYVMQKMMERGFYIPAIRYPSVERGKSRLRMSVSFLHSRDVLKEVMEKLSEVLMGV